MNELELRLGRYQDALADVGEVDALITDPPYSERTHVGHNEGAAAATRVTQPDKTYVSERSGPKRKYSQGIHRRQLAYDAWTAGDVREFVQAWEPRTRGWFVAMTDHVLAPAFEEALTKQGRYVFAPLHFMHVGSRVRLSGDGPSLWSTSIVVARPRSPRFLRWGALPGGYVLPVGHSERGAPAEIIGGKCLWIMRALVRDYSRAGDLVCDPCAGAASTLIAAAIERRRAIGAERDETTHARALKRIKRGFTPALFDDVR